MSQPLVSILMPVYNGAATIQAALDSLLSQTMQSCEFVIVNDGSSDETEGILQTYAARYQRMRSLNLPRVGLVKALNYGLAACQGEFVARMDSDDVSSSERLALQVDLFREQPHLSVVGALIECFPSEDVRQGFKLYVEWLNSVVTSQDIARDIFVESPLAHPSVMMRRKEVVGLGGYQDNGWPEDYDLWLRYHIAGKRMAKIPRVLLRWREHANRLTRTHARYSVENFLRAKAHYLRIGPLCDRDAIIIWGAGQMGRRLSKHLIRGGIPVVAFLDVDPNKIGRTLRGKPIRSVNDLPKIWKRYSHPVVLAAVSSRGARALIRERLQLQGFVEGRDCWCVA